MHIVSGNIGMESERRYSAVTRQSVRITRSSYTTNTAGLMKEEAAGLLSGWGDREDAKESKKATSPKGNPRGEDYAAQGSESWDAMMDLNNRFSVARSDKMDVREQFKTLNRIREQCLSYLLKLFNLDRRGGRASAGDDWLFHGFDKLEPCDYNLQPIEPTFNITTITADLEYYYEEMETTSFTTQGTVHTADGRAIDFDLELYMSRSFMEEMKLDSTMVSRSITFCDPLVINLEGNVPDLSDMKFLFDIDGDGTPEEISKLLKGSGYLAIDRNGNGEIDDGTELFGTASGDGFADLAAYDSDGNGFIDEADDIWDKLLIWTVNEKGEKILYTLKDKGIGAIGLQNADTMYSINSLADNTTKGAIRKTGIFLYENGNVGTVQHLDLAR